MPVGVLEVRAFDQRVGAVAPNPATGSCAFEYDDEWRRRGIELAPLHMPVSTSLYDFPTLARDTFHGLPPLLADSLPDRFGNALVDAWMAREGVTPRQITPLDRLAYMGTRGMGALTYHPPTRSEDEPATAIALADLVTAARRALRGEFGDDGGESMTNLIRVGTSAGGARPKAVIAFNPNTGQIRAGQFDAPEGFGQWLCKFDGVEATNTGPEATLGVGLPYGRIEYAYHLMAVAAGIHMTECRLMLEFDRAHFLTRRFDRTDQGGRLHVVTLCGLAHLDFNLPRTHDYAQYLDVVVALGLGASALEQAFARCVFNVAAVNCDDHTKNLSFLMMPDGTWHLAPAYDVTYAYNPVGRWASAHQMSVQGRFDGITRADLLAMADVFAVASPRGVIDRVVAAVGRWPEFAATAGVPTTVADEITSSHAELGLL